MLRKAVDEYGRVRNEGTDNVCNALGINTEYFLLSKLHTTTKVSVTSSETSKRPWYLGRKRVYY